MTRAGLKKLVTKPHIFVSDYMQKKFNKEKLKHLVLKSIDMNIPIHQFYYLLFQELKKQNHTYQATEALKKAITLKPNAVIYHCELGSLLKSKKQWWQAVEAFEQAYTLENLNMKYSLEYSYTLEKMNLFEKVCEVLKPLSEMEQLKSDGYFRYGNALEKMEEFDLAEEAFSRVIELDKKNDSKKLGIGIFYEKKGEWISAKKAYEKSLKIENFNANIQYKYGLSLERCYFWEKSEEEYLKAIGLKPNSIYWYYKLGFVRERKGDYKGASEAYLHAVSKRNTSYWYYRLGYVLSKLNDSENSCRAFLMMKKIVLSEIEEENDLSQIELLNDIKSYNNRAIEKLTNRLQVDSTDNSIWNELVNLYRDMGLYLDAADTLRELISRTNDFNGNLYFTLGHLLTLAKKYEEATDAFLEYRILQEAHGVSENNYNKNKGLNRIINYTEYYERYRIEDKTILYESYHGRSISCNPYAIFKELLDDTRFETYKHIWILDDIKKIPDFLKSYKNVIFVLKDSDLYMRYLASAKYLINNSTFPNYYIRKDGQFYLNTWHGTPIKFMGKDIRNDFMSHKNVIKNFLHTTHMIHPNKYTEDILLGTHDIADIYSGCSIEIGYPRQDLMLNISKEDKNNIYETLEIDSSQKIVLYAPTWRGTFGEADFDTTKLVADIIKLKEIENIQILFRGHYAAEKAFKTLDIPVTVVPDSIDTNSLLSVVDILITDYSSIAFDFLALERPIIYYVYDQKEYEEERGLYFPINELGGEICVDNSELKSSLEKVLLEDKITDKQKEAQLKFCALDDGKATQRVIDLFFFNNQNPNKSTDKQSILFYGGDFNPNGINTSYLNLLSHIDSDKYTITIVIDPNAVNNSDARKEQFFRLPEHINVVGRVGRMTMTLEEQWIKNKFESQYKLASDEMKNVYKKLYQREFKRIFGYAKFDAVIEFNGYGVFWPSLFANQPNNTIYQHNDMYGEWVLRFAALENIFHLYSNYNKMISVSEATMNHNINNLSELFNLNKNNFRYCDNVQNPTESLIKAEEELEVKEDKKIFENNRVFINIARLSPEKDQEKLIRAFSVISQRYPDIRLINLGSGALEHYLKQLIRELKLEKKVFFLGQRSNPYPYLKQADCFVLSSNHEGQPMTLFEALILKKPIIATDIVGNRSVLEGRPGLLVDNSHEGLEQGMIDFLEGKYKDEKSFDYEVYNQNALEMFYKKVLDEKE